VAREAGAAVTVNPADMMASIWKDSRRERLNLGPALYQLLLPSPYDSMPIFVWATDPLGAWARAQFAIGGERVLHGLPELELEDVNMEEYSLPDDSEIMKDTAYADLRYGFEEATEQGVGSVYFSTPIINEMNNVAHVLYVYNVANDYRAPVDVIDRESALVAIDWLLEQNLYPGPDPDPAGMTGWLEQASADLLAGDDPKGFELYRLDDNEEWQQVPRGPHYGNVPTRWLWPTRLDAERARDRIVPRGGEYMIVPVPR
jgi:hypothetical protein